MKDRRPKTLQKHSTVQQDDTLIEIVTETPLITNQPLHAHIYNEEQFSMQTTIIA